MDINNAATAVCCCLWYVLRQSSYDRPFGAVCHTMRSLSTYACITTARIRPYGHIRLTRTISLDYIMRTQTHVSAVSMPLHCGICMHGPLGRAADRASLYCELLLPACARALRTCLFCCGNCSVRAHTHSGISSDDAARTRSAWPVACVRQHLYENFIYVCGAIKRRRYLRR
jgi:hypothetical protein